MELEGQEQSVVAVAYHPGQTPDSITIKVDETKTERRRPCSERFSQFIHSTEASIYISRFLSAWGDRMWGFAVGVFLADLSPDDLRLVASYGFSHSVAGVLMGAIIGDVVDKYPRLKVARTVLAFQNILVALCAVLVCFVYTNKTYIYQERWKASLCEAGMIILSVIASLFSTAHRISVEKDWIAVICGGDSNKLATLGSITRAIDQVTNIAAPAATGLIMSYGSMFISAIFVAGWNVCSVFVEYGFLLRIYHKVPALAIKYSPHEDSENTEMENKEGIEGDLELAQSNQTVESFVPVEDKADKDSPAIDNSSEDEESARRVLTVPDPSADDNAEDGSNVQQRDEGSADLLSSSEKTPVDPQEQEADQSICGSVLKRIFAVFIALKDGWTVYFSIDLKYAGMGLAALYMTVLGFDNITIGYAYSQGASQALIGGMLSLSAITGIAATFTYPLIRKCIGIEKTGWVGSGSQILSLSLCVVSVWAPGSPFDPYFTTTENSGNTMEDSQLVSNTTQTNVWNSTQSTSTDVSAQPEQAINPISLALLMAGIIAARFGLWTFDLATSQLLLERVDQSKLGVINGVQSSLNMVMDMLKFILVIAIPAQRHFGILICLSFLSVCLGGVSYVVYTSKMEANRGNSTILCCFRRQKTYDTGASS